MTDTNTNTTNDQIELEVMPEEICEAIMAATGLDREDVIMIGEAGQKVRNMAMDIVSPGDSISPRNLAIAGLACKMAAGWLEEVAIKESMSAED